MPSEPKCFGGECLPALSMEEIYAIALEIWPDPALAAEMAATAMAESGGIPNRLGNDGEYGLWQIHPMHFDSTHSRFVGNDEYLNSLRKQGIIDDEGQSLSDPRINARAADAVARRLDWYTSHRAEGDLDMDNVFYGRRDNPDFSLFLEQAQALIGSDPPLASIDGPAGDFEPRKNDDVDDQPSQWGARPQMPGAIGPRPGDVKTLFNPVTFDDRVRQAMMDKNTPKIIPLQTRMSGQEFSALQRGTQDPDMRAALSRHAKNFRTGNAGFLGYETDEAARTAAKWLRVYGIGVDSQFPFIAYSLGKQAIDKTGDIASQLWDKAIGSLWDGMEDQGNNE